MAGVNRGQLNYSVTGCGSATYNFTGVPITNFSPPSGLLPPGGSSVALVFNTLQATSCRYSLGTALDFNSMLPLDAGPPVLAHSVSVAGCGRIPGDKPGIHTLRVRPDFLQSAAYGRLPLRPGSFHISAAFGGGSYIYSAAPRRAERSSFFRVRLFGSPGAGHSRGEPERPDSARSECRRGPYW